MLSNHIYIYYKHIYNTITKAYKSEINYLYRYLEYLNILVVIF